MADIPVVDEQSVGGAAGSAWANSVRDAAMFLLGTAAVNKRPVALLRQASAQAIPNSTLTPITFDAEDLDVDGGHSTATNPSRYTAQTSGWYAVDGVGTLAPGTSGARAVSLMINGVEQPGRWFQTTGSQVEAPVGRLVRLEAGDYLELGVYQTSGGSLNTVVASNATSVLSVIWQMA